MPKADRKVVAKNTILSKLAHTQGNISGRGLVNVSFWGTKLFWDLLSLQFCKKNDIWT